MLRVGAIVTTNYGTGPYRITDLDGPCTCPSYVTALNKGCDAPASEPHFHLTCSGITGRGRYWLNGFRMDGTSVWSKDALSIAKNRLTAELDLTDREIEATFAKLGLKLALAYGDAELVEVSKRTLAEFQADGDSATVVHQSCLALVLAEEARMLYILDLGQVRLVYPSQSRSVTQ